MASRTKSFTIRMEGGKPVLVYDGQEVQDPHLVVQAGDELTLYLATAIGAGEGDLTFTRPPKADWKPSRPASISWLPLDDHHQTIVVDNTLPPVDDRATSFELWVTDGSRHYSVLIDASPGVRARGLGVDPTIIEKADEVGPPPGY